MTTPAPRWNPPRPGSLGQPLRQLLQRLGGRPGSAAGQIPGRSNRQPADPLPLVGEQVRQAREAQGLNLRQLANETRISTTVLEAIERGWRDRLPEGTYLRSMLPLLERRLDLPSGSLGAILLPARNRAERERAQPGGVRRFTPGSIDVFTTWQGTVLYGLLALGLIHALNLQQRHLAARHGHSLVPIPASSARPAAAPSPLADEGERLLRAYPGLRPLSEARRPQLLASLRRQASGPEADLAQGRLQLQLQEPTRLLLRGGRPGATGVTRLEGVRGELDLTVLPPFQLELEPAPAPESVRWRGQALAAGDGDGRLFRYPPASGPRPASEERP